MCLGSSSVFALFFISISKLSTQGYDFHVPQETSDAQISVLLDSLRVYFHLVTFIVNLYFAQLFELWKIFQVYNIRTPCQVQKLIMAKDNNKTCKLRCVTTRTNDKQEPILIERSNQRPINKVYSLHNEFYNSICYYMNEIFYESTVDDILTS